MIGAAAIAAGTETWSQRPNMIAVAEATGALMNPASPGPWERFGWAPITSVLSGLCFLVARNSPALGG
jgi:hypothetical protein